VHQRLIIRERLPGMNELLGASTGMFGNAGSRGRHNGYSKLKKAWGQKIVVLCLEQRLTPTPAAHFRFTWIEPNRQRDPDNISAGKKLIFDGLVAAGILPEDGWSQILSIREEFRVNRACPGVVVDILSDSLV
jgi:hypothetical protein